MTLNLSVDVFLAYSGWFPVKLIVLFRSVVIILYVLVTLCSFFINALTSVCIRLPSDETRYQKSLKQLLIFVISIQNVRMWYLFICSLILINQNFVINKKGNFRASPTRKSSLVIKLSYSKY